jgi:acyl dehydratase
MIVARRDVPEHPQDSIAWSRAMNKQVEQRYLVNKTFDEIHVGDSASLTRTLMPEDVKLFAILTGDVNPAVVDPKFSESGMFREVIAHGMWSGSLISTVLGTQFPARAPSWSTRACTSPAR